MVKYENGIVFNVDGNKLQVTDNHIKNAKNAIVADLANKYIQKLPHVSYKAVGINFNGFVVCKNAESLILEKFLRPGSGNFNKTQPSTLGLRFLYKLPRTKLSLNCDAGKIKRNESDEDIEGLLVKANYHMDLSEENILDEIELLTSHFPKRYSHFIRITKKILALENTK